MTLRPYQRKAVEAVINCWQTCRSCLIVLPTGCGKTVVFGELVRLLVSGKVAKCEGVKPRAMILAHREELILQAQEKVGKICGTVPDVEMGCRVAVKMFGEWPDVIVSSVQTQTTGRYRKFDPDDFSALVIDEAHHATSRTYRTCIDHYLSNPCCRLLGVTATPDRADETALGNVFDAVAFEYSVTDAIRDGWLVPVKQRLVTVGTLDYSRVSTSCGDFNQGELAEVLEEERNLHGIAAPTIEICGSRRALVFATTVRQAERLAEIINRTRPNSAAWLCGKTPKEERKRMLGDFRDGRLQFVVNVGVLTEGFDDAGIEVVVMARPTKSRALYAQMAGRATRPAAEIAAKLGEAGEDEAASAARRRLIAESSKPSCLIVDFVGNSGRHKLVTMVDILGGKALDPDEEEARAVTRKRCAGDEELDALEALEDAREKVRANREEQARRRAFIQITAKYTTMPVDPFDVYDIPRPDAQTRCELDRLRLSYRQRQILRERIGVNPDGMTYSDGKALLDEHFERIKRGMATLKQFRFLRRRGLPVPMTFREASQTIGLMLDKGVRS